MSDRPCTQWIGAESRHCQATPTRLYTTGDQCAAHTPSALAGRPEVVPDPTLTLAALRVAAGRSPHSTSTAGSAALIDDRAIASGKRRASAHRFKEARAAEQARR